MKVDKAKQDLRSKRSAERKDRQKAAKAEARKQFKCYWTWPFGHEYKWSNSAQWHHCVGCDKPLPRF